MKSTCYTRSLATWMWHRIHKCLLIKSFSYDICLSIPIFLMTEKLPRSGSVDNGPPLYLSPHKYQAFVYDRVWTCDMRLNHISRVLLLQLDQSPRDFFLQNSNFVIAFLLDIVSCMDLGWIFMYRKLRKLQKKVNSMNLFYWSYGIGLILLGVM